MNFKKHFLRYPVFLKQKINDFAFKIVHHTKKINNRSDRIVMTQSDRMLAFSENIKKYYYT